MRNYEFRKREVEALIKATERWMGYIYETAEDVPERSSTYRAYVELGGDRERLLLKWRRNE